MKRLRVSKWIVCLTLLGVLSPPGVDGGLTGYLKIGDIPGESQATGHEREIDVHGIEWKISTPSASAGSGRVRGRAEVGPLKVKKFTDKSSPYLVLASLNGRAFPEITLTLRKDSGEAHLDYLVITMTNVSVSSFEVTSAGNEDNPVEEVGFVFEEIKYKYVEQADDHSAGDEHEIEYDIAAGV